MRRMRLLALSSLAMLVVAAGCGGGSSSSSSSGGPAGTIDKTPVTITMWDLWSGEEGKPFNDALKGFTKKYPWITVKQIVQPNTPNDTFDPNLVNAINGGNAPDVAMPFGPDYIGQYCSTGLWQDLTPYMQASHLSIDDFAPGAITYTNSGGKQCALPSLTDAFGLYYNTKMLAAGRHHRPPKTMDELMADAKKLTVRNPDGTIKVAGFVPLNQWEELGPGDLANAWGAKWFDSRTRPSCGTDPGWAAALRWQKQLIDWYGYDNITKFFAANTNNEFNNEQRVPDRQGGDDVRRRVAHRVHQARRPEPPVRHRAVPGRRIPSRPVRLLARRRHHRRHPQGRQAPRPGVAAGQVPGIRHQLPGADGERGRKRAHDQGLRSRLPP